MYEREIPSPSRRYRDGSLPLPQGRGEWLGLVGEGRGEGSGALPCRVELAVIVEEARIRRPDHQIRQRPDQRVEPVGRGAGHAAIEVRRAGAHLILERGKAAHMM